MRKAFTTKPDDTNNNFRSFNHSGIGLEFSLKELSSLWRYIVLGGPVQMLLVAFPVACFAGAAGLAWQPSMFLGLSIALSSTVCTILVRCRYRLTAEELHKFYADIIITEEIATTKALFEILAEKEII